LFNIIGVGNAKKMDIFVQILSSRAAAVKKATLQKLQDELDELNKKVNKIE